MATPTESLEAAVNNKAQLLTLALQRRQHSVRSSQELHHRNVTASAALLSIRMLSSGPPGAAPVRAGPPPGPRAPAAASPTTSSACQAPWVPPQQPESGTFCASDLLAVLDLPRPATPAPRARGSADGGGPAPRTSADAGESARGAAATIEHITAQLDGLRFSALGPHEAPLEAGRWWLESAYPVSDPLACHTAALSVDMSRGGVATAQRTAPSAPPPCTTTLHAILLSQRLDLAFMAAAARAGHQSAEGVPPVGNPAIEEIVAALDAMLPAPSTQAAVLSSTTLTLSAGPNKAVGVATGILNAVASLCGAALRRLPRHAWLQGVAAFVRGIAARGLPLAPGACGHPQKAAPGGPEQHEMHACPRCAVLIGALCAIRSILQGTMHGTFAGPQASPGPQQPLQAVLLHRTEFILTTAAVARAHCLRCNPKDFCRMYHAGGDVRGAFLRESACAVAVFQALRLSAQQVRSATELWNSWRSRHRSLDAVLRAACDKLDTLVRAADFVHHAAAPVVPAIPAGPPRALDPRLMPPRPVMAGLPAAAAWVRPASAGRRNTLPPLHRDLKRPLPPSLPAAVPPPPSFSAGPSAGPARIAHSQGPSLPRSLSRLGSSSSGGSGGGGVGGASDLNAAGFRIPERPATAVFAARGGPCVCAQCVATLAPKLVGLSPEASDAARCALRALRIMQEDHLDLCARTIRGVAVPGAFFSTGQMLGAEDAALRHGVASVDWLWVASMASQQTHGQDVLSEFDHGMWEC